VVQEVEDHLEEEATLEVEIDHQEVDRNIEKNRK